MFSDMILQVEYQWKTDKHLDLNKERIVRGSIEVRHASSTPSRQLSYNIVTHATHSRSQQCQLGKAWPFPKLPCGTFSFACHDHCAPLQRSPGRWIDHQVCQYWNVTDFHCPFVRTPISRSSSRAPMHPSQTKMCLLADHKAAFTQLS